MPNHVTTKITVTGSPEDIDRFLGHFANDDRGGVFLDFNSLIPMPEVLQDSVAGTTADDGAVMMEIKESFYPARERLHELSSFTRRKLTVALMKHNWSTKRAVDEVFRDEPQLAIDGEKKLRCIKETGHASWYDWSIKNWGTKWNSYAVETTRESDDRLGVKMETAWSFPLPILKAIAKKYHSLKFECICFDEGWCFAGIGVFHGHGCIWEETTATEDLYERVYGEPYAKDEED